MKNQHTPGPWKIDLNKHDKEWRVYHPIINSLFLGKDGKANARRIVACVNACEGINPAAVKDLLEACKAIQDRLAALDSELFDRLGIDAEEKLVSAAIRKAEGK